MYQFPLKVFPSHLNTAAKCLFKFSCQNDPELRGKFLDWPAPQKVVHVL